MLPVVCIVGHSRSGKTTLVEKLIAELGERGLRVAAVKHTGGSFEMDRPGKDTWRYGEAGCETVAILGPESSAVLRRRRRGDPQDELLRHVDGDSDLVLVEGLHNGRSPKIEVHRAALARGLRCAPDELLAVVTDEPLEVPCRQIASDAITEIADLLVEEIVGPAAGGAALEVNGKPVPLGSFTQRVIADTIVGLVSTLKGVDEIASLSVTIRRGRGRPAAKREARPEAGQALDGD
jgi:molybdopterin-guanine dinucleotide biosynthesis protein B